MATGQMVPRVPSPKPDTQECVGGTKLVGVRDRLKRPQNRFCLAGCHLHEVDDDDDDGDDDDDDDYDDDYDDDDDGDDGGAVQLIDDASLLLRTLQS